MRLVTLLLAVTLLAGCAATVRHPAGNDSAAAIPADAARNIVMNITGSPTATGAGDWPAFKEAWREAMAAAAGARGAGFTLQEGAVQPTGAPGTLVVVDVHDYRYLSATTRFFLGVLTGNAYVDATVKLVNLQTGTTLSERPYNTSSTAWQGAFSAMTARQLRAIADEVVAEINPH